MTEAEQQRGGGSGQTGQGEPGGAAGGSGRAAGGNRSRRRGGSGGRSQAAQGRGTGTGASSGSSSRRSGQGSSGSGSSGSSGRNRSRGGGGQGKGKGGSGGKAPARRGPTGGRPAGNRSSGGRTPRPPAVPAAAATDAAVEPATLAGLGGPTTEELTAVRATNRRRTTTLCLGAGVVVGAIVGVIVGLAAGLVAGAVAAVVVVVAVAVAVRRVAVRAALSSIRAVPVATGSWPRVENMVDGLCASFGLSRPRVMVLKDPVPNACVLGEQSGGVLVLTSSLVEQIDVMELEGVLAHELAHLKADDGVLAAVAVTVLGPWIAITGSSSALHRVLGKGREYRADAIAVTTVRYPPGLQRALAGLAGTADALAPESYFATRRANRTRWLWIDPLPGAPADGRPDDGQLDRTDVRAAALADW